MPLQEPPIGWFWTRIIIIITINIYVYIKHVWRRPQPQLSGVRFLAKAQPHGALPDFRGGVAEPLLIRAARRFGLGPQDQGKGTPCSTFHTSGIRNDRKLASHTQQDVEFACLTTFLQHWKKLVDVGRGATILNF